VDWHSLVDHSADVAAVVAALLSQPTINGRLGSAAGRASLDAVTCARLAALAFLHDIGKANRGFRRRIDASAPTVGHIDELVWLFNSDLAERLSTVLGLKRTDSWFASEDALELWDAVYAHHGRPWSRDPASAAPY
jgi:CRISPR-associated endonuclease/helicase Cas3